MLVFELAAVITLAIGAPKTATSDSWSTDSVFSRSSQCFFASLPPIHEALTNGQRPLVVVNDSNTGRRLSLPVDCPTSRRPAELRSFEYLIPEAAVRYYAKEGEEGIVRIRWGPKARTAS